MAVVTLTVAVAGCGSEAADKGTERNAPTKTDGGPSRAETTPTATPAGDENAIGLASSDVRYLDRINDAQSSFASEAGELNLANPEGPKDFKRSLDKLVGIIDGLVGKIEDITPPAAVRGEHDRLIEILATYAKLLRDQKGALASGDQTEVVSAATRIGTGSTKFSAEFDETITAITDRLQR